MNDLSIHKLRRYLSWCFAFTSLLLLFIPIWRVALQIYRHCTSLVLPILFRTTLFLVGASIFGAAWSSVRKERPFARGWGIAASLTYLLIFLFHSLSFPWQSVRGHHVGALVIGTIGMVAFLRRDEQHHSRSLARW